MSGLLIILCALMACIVSGEDENTTDNHYIDVDENNFINYQNSTISAFDSLFMAHIVTSESDSFPCPGVAISRRHILTTYSCILSKNNYSIRLGFSSPDPIIKRARSHFRNVDYGRKSQSCAERFQNSLAVVLLEDEIRLGDQIAMVSLPTQHPQVNTHGRAVGLTGVCSHDSTTHIQEFPMEVASRGECWDIRYDEFCIKHEPMQFYELTHGAAFLDDQGTIFGFTNFGCNTVEGVVLNVFPFVRSLRRLMLGNTKNARGIIEWV